MNNKANFLIIGGSRGIGLATAEHFSKKFVNLFCVSRTKGPFGTWIEADVSAQDGIHSVARAVEDLPLDALLYLGGTWEENAFTDAYRFDQSSRLEIEQVIAVNLTAPIHLVQKLTPNLQQAENPKIIFIGALSGLDNAATKEVANSASKYGLRGAAQSLRLTLRDLKIGVTVINPGNLATEEVQQDISTGNFMDQQPIPLSDLISAIDFVLQTSNDCCVSEINLYQQS